MRIVLIVIILMTIVGCAQPIRVSDPTVLTEHEYKVFMIRMRYRTYIAPTATAVRGTPGLQGFYVLPLMVTLKYSYHPMSGTLITAYRRGQVVAHLNYGSMKLVDMLSRPSIDRTVRRDNPSDMKHWMVVLGSKLRSSYLLESEGNVFFDEDLSPESFEY